MNVWRMNLSLLLLGLLVSCAQLPQQVAHQTQQQILQQAQQQTEAGTANILLVAPDRGFMGNEEVRHAFAQLEQHNKALVFITDDRSRAYLEQALAELSERVSPEQRSSEINILPLFISNQNPRWQLARRWLQEGVCQQQIQCSFNKVFGESYLAVELLEKALQQAMLQQSKPPAHHEHGQQAPLKELLLIGAGADSWASAEQMAESLEKIAARASQASAFQSIKALVWAGDEDRAKQSEQLQQLAKQNNRVLVPFHLGKKLDGMMNYDAFLHHLLGEEHRPLQIATIDSEVMTLWLQRESNRSLIKNQQNIGVVVLAHGSDFHWNQTMREALESLQSQYTIEFAFSMADRQTIAAALERLQQRGMKGAVIVRVYGREDSFLSSIEKMLGMDIESENKPRQKPHAARHSMMGMSAARIRTPLIVTTVGGLEAHPLFAKALLDRANQLSRDPKQETVILVAHGSGSDQGNVEWLQSLQQLADHMRRQGGEQYRAIKFATWREDWPSKREPWVARIRDMVQTATENNGRAIVIPARTNARGSEPEFLAGMDYALGEGFAPHPLFSRWVQVQIEQGLANLRKL